MTIPRFILGKRGSDFGAFISPPGVDASTAATDQLLLNITSATAQLVMQGIITSPFGVVPHSLGYAPVIFPNLNVTGIGGALGYVRPSFYGLSPLCNSNIKSEATQFTFNQSGTVVVPIAYFVFNKPAP